MSNERLEYLKQRKKEKLMIIIIRLLLTGGFILTWEILSYYKIIDSFLYSSPSLILEKLISLYQNNNLFIHIFQTLKEIAISFILAQMISIILAITLYEFKLFAKIIDPFIILINSMPKVALGPLIIIIGGANIKSIIIMALLINVIVTTITIQNGINQIDENKIKLLKSLKCTKIQELKYLIIPSSKSSIISSLKINISMTLIGVIMGEFLVSKQGIGYLIIYGSQIFDTNLVYCGIVILLVISFILYKLISIIYNKK